MADSYTTFLVDPKRDPGHNPNRPLLYDNSSPLQREAALRVYSALLKLGPLGMMENDERAHALFLGQTYPGAYWEQPGRNLSQATFLARDTLANQGP
jgi:hypothetical protein